MQRCRAVSVSGQRETALAELAVVEFLTTEGSAVQLQRPLLPTEMYSVGKRPVGFADHRFRNCPK
jgi:hypothetical protein